MTTQRITALAASRCFLLLALNLALSSCGTETSSNTSLQRNVARPPIRIEPPSDFASLETGATPPRIEAGETATWQNGDTREHTITSEAGDFDSGQLAPGASFGHVFTKAGHYKYHCKLHGEAGEVWVIEPHLRSSHSLNPYPTHGQDPGTDPGQYPAQNPTLPPVCAKKDPKDCKPEPQPTYKPVPMPKPPQKPCPPPSAQQSRPPHCGDDPYEPMPQPSTSSTPYPPYPTPSPSMSPDDRNSGRRTN